MMGGMRPPGSPSQLERRRRRALELLKRGLTQSAVAEQLGCANSSVSRWHHTFERAGPKGLAPKPIPGRPPKLSASQRQRLVQRLVNGPLACGYGTDLWTLPRIADQIARQFHVRYHQAHWKRYVWPHIKKG